VARRGPNRLEFLRDIAEGLAAAGRPKRLPDPFGDGHAVGARDALQIAEL
jgi:hypothetical protein